MKISIITASYNTEKIIEQAIRSVQSQTYTLWEHIIVDGKSTDGTVGILKKHPHIKWISEPDSGVYDAMNKGVKMATGDFIYFLGADDFFYSDNVLAEVSEHLLGNDVVYGDVMSERMGGRYGGAIDRESILKKNICHQGIFFSRKVFSVIGTFNLKYRLLADWEHNMRWMFADGITAKYIPILIANFTDGGLSDRVIDQEFSDDKRELYLKLSKNKISTKIRLKVAFSNMNYHLKKKKSVRISQAFKLLFTVMFFFK